MVIGMRDGEDICKGDNIFQSLLNSEVLPFFFGCVILLGRVIKTRKQHNADLTHADWKGERLTVVPMFPHDAHSIVAFGQAHYSRLPAQFLNGIWDQTLLIDRNPQNKCKYQEVTGHVGLCIRLPVIGNCIDRQLYLKMRGTLGLTENWTTSLII